MVFNLYLQIQPDEENDPHFIIQIFFKTHIIMGVPSNYSQCLVIYKQKLKRSQKMSHKTT